MLAEDWCLKHIGCVVRRDDVFTLIDNLETYGPKTSKRNLQVLGVDILLQIIIDDSSDIDALLIV